MTATSSRIKGFLQKVPSRKTFSIYRFLPFFFKLETVMECFMINVQIGQETFYDVYRRKWSERKCQDKLEGLTT
ncbi:small integral membrane protein 4-like [Protopterus annectens]|uniref:small integral membrane protein 4-like n=1 Tax=Protopterus annectens TaxID=7888 RepID=UPI001CFAA8E2|nr:small integral membrane protein 4-like [Protopterus annectens]